MKTEIIFYFLRNRNHTTWVAVDDYGVDVAFKLGNDCFEGVADSIPAWCEARGYDCVQGIETKDRFIDWEGRRVYHSEQEYLEHKEWQRMADDYGAIGNKS